VQEGGDELMAVPLLETERLLLRPRGIGDLDAIMAMSADPEVMAYLTAPGDDVAAFRARMQERVTREEGPGLGAWSLFARTEPARFLGWVSLNPMPEAPEDIELGYRSIRAAWGQGYVSEAARAALAYGFGVVGLDEIVAVVHPQNLRSQAVLRRLGFRRDGERAHAGGPWLFHRLAAPSLVDN
jgi:RimJ/RimL family protein N-acetyltransferase